MYIYIFIYTALQCLTVIFPFEMEKRINVLIAKSFWQNVHEHTNIRRSCAPIVMSFKRVINYKEILSCSVLHVIPLSRSKFSDLVYL